MDGAAVRIEERQRGGRAALEPGLGERHANDGARDAIEIAEFEDAAAPGRIPLDPVQHVLNRLQNLARMPIMTGIVQRELSSLIVSSPVPARLSICDRPDIQRRPICP